MTPSREHLQPSSNWRIYLSAQYTINFRYHARSRDHQIHRSWQKRTISWSKPQIESRIKQIDPHGSPQAAISTALNRGLQKENGQKAVHERANHRRIEGSRCGNESSRALQEGRHRRRHPLPMEGEMRRPDLSYEQRLTALEAENTNH